MTTMYVPSIAVDDVIDAVAAFVLPFVPGGQVIRAQVGRVTLPPDPFVLLTEVTDSDTCIPYEADQWQDSTSTILGPTKVGIQADFFGALAGDYCKAVKSAFRTLWGSDQFPDTIQPLYTSEPHQAPLITGEQQYETRWIITLYLQYTPITTVPQQFATELQPTINPPVDLTDLA